VELPGNHALVEARLDRLTPPVRAGIVVPALPICAQVQTAIRLLRLHPNPVAGAKRDSPDDGRTAIRGAYGISYYRDNFGANGGTLERNHPLFQQVDLQTPNQFVPSRSVSDGLPGFTSVPLTPTIAPPPGFAVFFFPVGLDAQVPRFRVSRDLSMGNPPHEAWLDQFGGFIQNDWRLNQRLMLNLGLRAD
jgi:outer membrane receptor protein involved in Fe transport